MHLSTRFCMSCHIYSVRTVLFTVFETCVIFTYTLTHEYSKCHNVYNKGTRVACLYIIFVAFRDGYDNFIYICRDWFLQIWIFQFLEKKKSLCSHSITPPYQGLKYNTVTPLYKHMTDTRLCPPMSTTKFAQSRTCLVKPHPCGRGFYGSHGVARIIAANTGWHVVVVVVVAAAAVVVVVAAAGVVV